MARVAILNPIDSFNHAGAAELASRIRRYWEQRGYDVYVSADKQWTPGGYVQGVRSDLVNGFPRRKAAELSQH